MTIPTFALEVWMHEHEARPLRYDLSGSTGPVWTLSELLALEDLTPDAIAADPLTYAPVTGSGELREAVAEHTGSAPEHVRITSGAAEGLAMLVAAGATPGGNVVFPNPGYPSFGALPAIFDQEPRPYRLSRNDRFRLDPQAVIDLIDDRTGLVLVNTPHNPTGATVDATAMRAIQEAAAQRGVVLAIDQVQHPIAHAGISASGAAVAGALLIGDMSKAMSLAGLRLGWIVDTDRERQKSYFDLRGFFTISSSPLSERLSAIALRQRQRVLARAQSVGSQNLAVLRAFFDRHADRFHWVEPAGGLIAFPWVINEPSARPLCERLAAEGILLSPGDCFDHPEHFRVAFGATEPEQFTQALAAIEKIVVAEPAPA